MCYMGSFICRKILLDIYYRWSERLAKSLSRRQYSEIHKVYFGKRNQDNGNRPQACVPKVRDVVGSSLFCVVNQVVTLPRSSYRPNKASSLRAEELYSDLNPIFSLFLHGKHSSLLGTYKDQQISTQGWKYWS